MSIEPSALRQVPLFTSLDEGDLARVAAITVERRYGRGEILLLEGDLGGPLHYVRSGHIKVYRTSPEGKEQVLRLVGPGETFNDVPALDGGPNPASAAAIESTDVFVTGRAGLRTLILERPAMAEAAIQSLATALRHLVAVVETLSFRHVTARVAKILLDQEFASRDGQTGYRLTQQEMAAMAGTAREMVGRALKELEAMGAIEMHHGRAVVVDLDRLQLMA
jgi:CRP/FNR family transcriptional regulator